jgi:hypothetical protein
MEENTNTKNKRGLHFILLFILLTAVVTTLLCKEFKDKEVEKINFQLETYKKTIPLQIQEKINKDKELKEEDFINKLVEVIEHIQPKLDPILITEIAINVINQCKEKKLDPYIIFALIFVESTFDPMVESDKGAVGLMQVRYETWKETPQLHSNGVDKKYKLFWIKENIQCGTDIFLKYYKASNYDLTRTLWRYNSGQPNLPSNTGRYDIGYVNKVYAHSYRIKNLVETLNVNEEETEE